MLDNDEKNESEQNEPERSGITEKPVEEREVLLKAKVQKNGMSRVPEILRNAEELVFERNKNGLITVRENVAR